MDIDIDTPTQFDPRKIMKQAIAASVIKGDKLVKHNCGYYFQTIPVDDITGVAAIPHTEAEQFGFFKFDILHLGVLDNFTSKSEIRRLIKQEPDWTILQNPEHIPKLFQIGNQADLISQFQPTSIIELADCIALIRPGKRRLINQYLRSKDKTAIRKELYTINKDEIGYCYKKPHAISYALTIVLQLHLIAQGKL